MSATELIGLLEDPDAFARNHAQIRSQLLAHVKAQDMAIAKVTEELETPKMANNAFKQA